MSSPGSDRVETVTAEEAAIREAVGILPAVPDNVRDAVHSAIAAPRAARRREFVGTGELYDPDVQAIQSLLNRIRRSVDGPLGA
jgi:AMMECR1 domain-containing protein